MAAIAPASSFPAGLTGTGAVLDVVVEGELPRMRPQPHRVGLLAALVVDPGLDQVLVRTGATGITATWRP